MSKKRARNDHATVPEAQCLIIQPSEDASVYYYQVAARLITPEVREAVTDGDMGLLFLDESERNEDYWKERVATLDDCLQPLIGQITPVTKGEQWAGAFAEGPWASFLAIYNWA